MSDERAFLLAILDNPDDDHLRLVFADWLEERGDPRGEFIRVQLELDDGVYDTARKKELLIRQHQLLALYQHEWLGPLRDFPGDVEFERGFPARVRLDTGVFLEHAGALFESWPLRYVRLRRLQGHVPAVAKCAALGKVRSLDLSHNNLDDTSIAVLVESPQVASLQELNIDMNGLDLPGARAIAQSPHLGALESLSIGHNSIGDLGVHALASSANLTRLRTLGLGLCEIGPTGTRYLEQLLLRLAQLDLSNNPLHREGLTLLAASPHVSGLSALQLNSVASGPRGIAVLADSQRLQNLRRLSLQGNHIADSDAAKLALSSLHGLEELNLRGNPLSRSGKEKLRARFGDKVQFD